MNDEFEASNLGPDEFQNNGGNTNRYSTKNYACEMPFSLGQIENLTYVHIPFRGNRGKAHERIPKTRTPDE
jgi:hypothetical protein